ncbi:DUF4440 domain-containing protein [Xanthomonas sp. A2111]|uniref:Nuclear transport factor 2 family protein n=1 Tax=Xanthomonas hawaiiensis TaxID=3003247 RepID=A0ABU2I610_9XANT|nr:MULTISPECIES: nuclear transport factor 2 family protein [unclassified Xanthomonas]MBO9830526.1 DUF4440 domain-containing protein [Xanthomonas sp. A2111]MBO9875798.1 DUF4440 domain-containing protein [Xanthomonas sp. D-93]MDS9993583.1 nuclear transport factor 2 family protein [Xanthomonas sp. A2111]WNH45330.1 nuclear transport factor 2 family protein [Xanthomonas sp. A6251]
MAAMAVRRADCTAYREPAPAHWRAAAGWGMNGEHVVRIDTMRRRFLPLSVLFGACPSAMAAATADASTDSHAIAQVVQAFGQAIRTRDADGFRALFLPDAVTWRQVYADESLRRLRQRRALEKVPQMDGDSPGAMIDGIVRAGGAVDEPVAGLQILSDGDVATVFFRYSYCVDGAATNAGSESWQLLRTEAGWRIASVVWSVRLPPLPGTAPACR